MARRPPHLRWIYVKEHPRPFLGLVLVTVLGLAAVAFLLSDPARGLSLGAMPVAFGMAVWALTNRAGYPDRDPASLPHERHDPEPASQPIPSPAAASGDPFSAAGAPPPTPVKQPSSGRRGETVPAAPPPPGGQSSQVAPSPRQGTAAAADTAATTGRKATASAASPAASQPQAVSAKPAKTKSLRQEAPGGETARSRKEQARKAKSSTPRKRSPGEADQARAKPGTVPTQAHDDSNETPPLTPAEAAIQAAATRKAKRDRNKPA